MSVTAIFGGTFNPFHIGHYEILKALQQNNCIDEIFIMPDRIPPHKKCNFLADDETRIQMCFLAANEFSKAKLCLVEFEREGKSFTYDTILYLKKIYPQKKFAFVCGGDMLVTFEQWYNYKELMKLLSFIVFRRSDIIESFFDDCVNKFKKMGMEITVIDTVIPCVSSTQIRNNPENLKEFLPKAIYDFLSERGTYDNV